MPIRRLSAWLAFAALLSVLSVLSMLSACDAESESPPEAAQSIALQGEQQASECRSL